MADSSYGVLKTPTGLPQQTPQQNVTKTSLLSEALDSNPYSYDALLFPSDIGVGAGLQDYVLFNINENVAGGVPQIGDNGGGGQTEQQITASSANDPNNTAGQAKDVNNLVGKKRGTITVQGELGRSSTQAAFANPNRQRIKTSIALPLPISTVSASYNANWEAVNLGAVGGSLDRFNVSSAAMKQGSVTGGIKAGIGDGGEAGAVAGYMIAPEDLRAGLEKQAGYAMNPRTEVVYRGTPNRTFTFEFRLSPATPEEAAALERIIQVFKYAQAPELDGGFGSWLKYPDDFDIGFYYNGDRNTHVHRISSCALTQFNVDYSGGQGGLPSFKDGNPQTVVLSLQFIELEMITKKRVTEGY